MRWRGKIRHSRTGHSWQYGACTLHAAWLRLQIHTQNSNTAFQQRQCLDERPSMLRVDVHYCLVPRYFWSLSMLHIDWLVRHRHSLMLARDDTVKQDTYLHLHHIQNDSHDTTFALHLTPLFRKKTPVAWTCISGLVKNKQALRHISTHSISMMWWWWWWCIFI